MKIKLDVIRNNPAAGKTSFLEKLGFAIDKKLSVLMRNPFYLLVAIMLLCSHDLYLKMETYFFEPNQEATLNLYNGTFEKSENIITRDRMLDASVVADGKRVAIKSDQWQDQDSTITQFTFTTGEEGTYVAGVSTKARNIVLDAEAFNSYLEHDGILDMLEQREKDGSLDQGAVESYQKHVKAIYQVGDKHTNDWRTVLGYPIEFVPQANPYEKHSGEKLDVQLLLEGKPLANQLVYADYIQGNHGHSHDHSHDSEEEEAHTHTSGQQMRTNAQGIATVDLPEDGIYYLRTIHMVTVKDSEELTHQSKWATLTFEVSHKHGSSILHWLTVLVSLLILGLLYRTFKKKN